MRWSLSLLPFSRKPVDLAPAPAPNPTIRAVFYHRGVPIIAVIPANIQAITVPVYADHHLTVTTYRRQRECMPADDGLAVVFTLDKEGDDHE